MLSLCMVAESFGKGAAVPPVPVASCPVGVARWPSFQLYIFRSPSVSACPFLALARELLTLGPFVELLPDVWAVAIWLAPIISAMAKRLRFMIVFLVRTFTAVLNANALPIFE